MPTDHAILFTGEMVRAILEDRKTQTRRVMKPQPTGVPSTGITCDWLYCGVEPSKQQYGFDGVEREWRSPYGGPGDVLVPRTTWAVHPALDHFKPSELTLDGVDAEFWHAGQGGKPTWAGKSRSGRFLPKHLWPLMPRLPTTDVRVQRVQEISGADCMAEGIGIWEAHPDDGPTTWTMFQQLWDSINARRGYGWDVNPWVWAVTFKRRAEP